jgi:hypothetical protein
MLPFLVEDEYKKQAEAILCLGLLTIYTRDRGCYPLLLGVVIALFNAVLTVAILIAMQQAVIEFARMLY